MKYLTIFLIAFLSCNAKPNENAIVLINFEEFDGNREKIAEAITILNSFSPRVIAIDLKFPDNTDEISDNKLNQALKNYLERLVLTNDIIGYEERLDEYPGVKPTSVDAKSKAGYVTSIEEDDVFFTVKNFATWEKINGRIEYQFGVQTAMLFDSMKTALFIKNHPKTNGINFHNGKKFKIISGSDLIKGRVERADIEGKIAMVGFIGPGFTDKYYSGAIKRGNGSWDPDMYDVETQAHIVLQVLSE